MIDHTNSVELSQGDELRLSRETDDLIRSYTKAADVMGVPNASDYRNVQLIRSIIRRVVIKTVMGEICRIRK